MAENPVISHFTSVGVVQYSAVHLSSMVALYVEGFAGLVVIYIKISLRFQKPYALRLLHELFSAYFIITKFGIKYHLYLIN